MYAKILELFQIPARFFYNTYILRVLEYYGEHFVWQAITGTSDENLDYTWPWLFQSNHLVVAQAGYKLSNRCLNCKSAITYMITKLVPPCTWPAGKSFIDYRYHHCNFGRRERTIIIKTSLIGQIDNHLIQLSEPKSRSHTTKWSVVSHFQIRRIDWSKRGWLIDENSSAALNIFMTD